MATINKDGTIDFGGWKGLLSITDITVKAIGFLVDAKKAENMLDQHRRIIELRRSCGVEPEKSRSE
jgi:hypothetical protein